MTIESLQELATWVLALSAANERLIEAIKNLLAPWLAKEVTRDGEVVDPVKDRYRQLAVQALSILSALVVASLVAAESGETFGSRILLGSTPIHVAVVALFTSGGSAFWNSILDFVRAAAKLREQKTDTARLLNESNLPALPGAARLRPMGG